MLMHKLVIATMVRSAPLCSRTAVPALSGAYGFRARELISGNDVEMSDYKGQVSLVVNLASK